MFATLPRTSPRLIIALLLLVNIYPQAVLAHADFAPVYTLPVPIDLYIYGAAAALLLSFIVFAWFVTGDSAHKAVAVLPINALRFPTVVIRSLQIMSLGLLVLVICAGFIGTQRATENINMTYFWIILVLGVAYGVALLGNAYAVINPWRVLCRLLTSLLVIVLKPLSISVRPVFNYPKLFGYWPALLLYSAFIWLELFGNTTPLLLSQILLAYSLLNVVGAALFGVAAWFKYVEFFSVFMHLLGTLGLVARNRSQGLHIREPLAGVLQYRAQTWGIVVFILFMLSSTAFDGLHEAKIYVDWLRDDLVAGGDPKAFYVGYQDNLALYTLLNQGFLLVSPLLYLSIYLCCIVLMKWSVGSQRNVKQLSLDFAYTLIPIALVYHFAHYYAILVVHGPTFPSLLSDPFGFNWDLLGTASWYPFRIVPDVESMWYTQVSVIVLGHIWSTYLAHRVALQVFGSQKKAIISQIPMLLLMVIFTGFGLWILGQPIKQ